jgi:hypothetical protein
MVRGKDTFMDRVQAGFFLATATSALILIAAITWLSLMM